MPDSTLLLSATPLLMRVEPLRQDPVPVVAQGQPDEREQVKVKPGDEYLLYERGRLPLLGLCCGGLVCGCCVAQEGLLLRGGHMLEILRRLPVQWLRFAFGGSALTPKPVRRLQTQPQRGRGSLPHELCPGNPHSTLSPGVRHLPSRSASSRFRSVH